MKVLFLSNNVITKPIELWLSDKDSVTVHSEKLDIGGIKAIAPDHIVSYNYAHIIKADVIEYMRGNIVNLHISYLPFNRGSYPNVWAFLEGTPHGVTIHRIDAGIDTGDIFVQKQIRFNAENETFETSYNKLHKEIQTLFTESWANIKNGNLLPQPQIDGGTHHTTKQFAQLNELLPLEWNMNVTEYLSRYRGLPQ